jgi:membrane protease YdiL (CAAX protease family)
VRDAVVALLAGLGASLVGALVVRRGGLSTRDLFAVVLPLQSLGTLLAAWRMARSRGPVTTVLALRARWRDLVGVAVGAGIQIASAAVAVSIVETFFDGEVPGQELVDEAGGAAGWEVRALVILGLVVLGPLAEEVVFRGMLLPALLHRGRRAAVLLSSAGFALIHLVDPNAAFSVPFLFVLAVILANERLRTGGLGRPVAIHAGFNLVTVIAVFVA